MNKYQGAGRHVRAAGMCMCEWSRQRKEEEGTEEIGKEITKSSCNSTAKNPNNPGKKKKGGGRQRTQKAFFQRRYSNDQTGA